MLAPLSGNPRSTHIPLVPQYVQPKLHIFTQMQIHDGPYNVIKNWDYCALVEALRNGKGEGLTARVRCVQGWLNAAAGH